MFCVVPVEITIAAFAGSASESSHPSMSTTEGKSTLPTVRMIINLPPKKLWEKR
jgi:hypothetical protein